MITDDVVGQLAAVVKSLAVDRVFVLVDETIRERAVRPIHKMLEMSK